MAATTIDIPVYADSNKYTAIRITEFSYPLKNSDTRLIIGLTDMLRITPVCVMQKQTHCFTPAEGLASRKGVTNFAEFLRTCKKNKIPLYQPFNLKGTVIFCVCDFKANNIAQSINANFYTPLSVEKPSTNSVPLIKCRKLEVLPPAFLQCTERVSNDLAIWATLML